MLEEEDLSYHALVVATGSKTTDPVFSMHTDSAALIDAIRTRNIKLQSARDIIIVGGGATGVETAGEIGELKNGVPSRFGTPTRNANITLITAANQLVPQLRPALGRLAEEKLKRLGVDVVYNTRIVDVSDSKNGRTTVTLAKGRSIDVDLYIPAHGVTPNSSFIPASLLTESGYLKTNPKTLRVDAAGPRVYAIGDIASYSRNCYLDIYDSSPTLFVNLKRDLLSYPNEKPKGKDRLFTPNMKEMQCVPIGSTGGVGALMGWRMPNWMVWLLKARDYMTSMGQDAHARGDKVKEVEWTNEEAAI
jgi:NADH dehydrogenase FAD-containing subunit